MARKPAKSQAASTQAAPTEAPKKVDPRRVVVEALLRLAADQPYGDISLAEIAREANLSLADLRDLFPSKGAIIGGLMRMIDREVLDGTGTDMTDETMHDRLLDVMMRRLDAFDPYKEGMRAIYRSIRSDPVFALQINQAATNSWRYMLEAAGIETGGALGAMRVQGAVLVFSKAFGVWLDDSDDMAKTMATLDRELKRGEQIMRAADGLHRLAAPFRGFARAVCEKRRNRSRDQREEAESYG